MSRGAVTESPDLPSPPQGPTILRGGQPIVPSPFPGMDPFIEGQEWSDFHTRFTTVVGELLAPPLRRRYVVRVERRVYVEHLFDDTDRIIPDVVVLDRGRPPAHRPTGPTSTAAAIPPAVECILPMPEGRREAFLVIRSRGTNEVVTVLEVLSPANKTRGADGRREYLAKRESVLQSSAHLVEIDLLRGGERLPVVGAVPEGDYFAFVCRRERRPRADVYSWTLRDRLPAIPVPLAAGDADVELDLHAAFAMTYDRAVYEDSLDYGVEPVPPFAPADAEWAREVLAAAS